MLPPRDWIHLVDRDGCMRHKHAASADCGDDGGTLPLVHAVRRR
jgi:hypothetical protein